MLSQLTKSMLGCFCLVFLVSFIRTHKEAYTNNNTPTPDKLLSLFKDTTFKRLQVEARYDDKGRVKGFRNIRLPEDMYSLLDYTNDKKQKQSLHKEWFYLIGNKFTVYTELIVQKVLDNSLSYQKRSML